MKVALVARALYPIHGHGGLERHVAALRRHLELAGCEVRVFTTPPAREPKAEERDGLTFISNRFVPWPRGRGFTILDRDTNYLLWSLSAAKALLADYAPDVVQADGGAGFGYAMRRSGGDAPLILHPHGMEEFKTTPLKRAAYLPLRWAIRRAASKAACVIAPDASMESEVSSLLGVERERIRVVPNAIDLGEIDRPRDRVDLKALGVDDDDVVLLSVGRLESNKGFDVLARALGRVREKLPARWRWLLVGDGPQRRALDDAIEAHGIAAHARLLGSVPDETLFALYERASLVVHPTRFEGSSMVTLEAMAHRKPVVASHVGGIPDKIVDGRSGRLVPPGDEAALVRALADAFSEPERLAAWGEEARRQVETGFSWERRTEDLLTLYRTLARQQ